MPSIFITDNAPPSEAPEIYGQKFVNLVTKQMWRAKGTSSVADWELLSDTDEVISAEALPQAVITAVTTSGIPLWVRQSSTDIVTADWSSESTAEVLGAAVTTSVGTSIVTGGPVSGFTNLSKGDIYYLTANGTMSNAEVPVGKVRRPVLYATSDTAGLILTTRGQKVLAPTAAKDLRKLYNNEPSLFMDDSGYVPAIYEDIRDLPNVIRGIPEVLPSTAPGLVWPGRTVSEIETVSGILAGNSGGQVASPPSFVQRVFAPGQSSPLTLWIHALDGIYTTGVQLQFSDSAEGVTVSVLAAKYVAGDQMANTTYFDTLGTAYTIATMASASGYNMRNLRINGYGVLPPLLAPLSVNGNGDWNGAKIAQFNSVSGLADGQGRNVFVPPNTELVWVRVLDSDRWTVFKAHIWNTVNELFTPPDSNLIGHFGAGFDAVWPLSPDGKNIHAISESANTWFPIPIPPSLVAAGGNLCLRPISTPHFSTGNSDSGWLSGIAFTRNPYRITKMVGVQAHWMIHPVTGREAGHLTSGSNGNAAGSGISWGGTNNYTQYTNFIHTTIPGAWMMPVVDDGTDRELIIGLYGHDSRPLTPPETITVDGTVFTRPTFRRNRITELHPETRMPLRFFSMKLPAALVSGKKWLKCEVLTSSIAYFYLSQAYTVKWED